MSRPFMQYGVGQLEELFAKSKADQKVLKQLEHELQYRQVPRAVALLAEVQAAMYGGRASSPPAPTPTPLPAAVAPVVARQPELWGQPAQPPAAVAPPPTTAASAVRPTPPPDLRPTAPTEPTVPLQDAYKLLKATPSSTWESIERARRLLVQASHPGRLETLSADKRGQALAEAKRVNEAYAVLSQARCAGR